MTSDGQVSTSRELLELLSASEQATLGSVSSVSLVALLRRVRDSFGQERLEEVLKQCCPELNSSWSITTATGTS